MKLFAVLLQLLAVVVLAFPIQAQNVFHRRAAFRSAWLFSDDFEDGTLGKWTETTTGTPNISVSATSPPAGTYSARTDDPNNTVAIDTPDIGADYSTIYVGCLFVADDRPITHAGVFRIRDGAGTVDLLRVEVSTTGQVRALALGGSTTSYTTGVLSNVAGTGTPVLLEYTRGTGSNGTATVRISTDGSTWTDSATSSNGTDTSYPRIFRWINVAAWNYGGNLDNVIVSDTTLTPAQIIAGP